MTVQPSAIATSYDSRTNCVMEYNTNSNYEDIAKSLIGEIAWVDNEKEDEGKIIDAYPELIKDVNWSLYKICLIIEVGDQKVKAYYGGSDVKFAIEKKKLKKEKLMEQEKEKQEKEEKDRKIKILQQYDSLLLAICDCNMLQSIGEEPELKVTYEGKDGNTKSIVISRYMFKQLFEQIKKDTFDLIP